MNTRSSATTLRMTVYAALFTALIIIGGYISIPVPVGPVPIALADFFVMLTALFLGNQWGAVSVGLFLALGILGLPVFAGGKAGLAVLFGPTGGFLFGYLLLVPVVGFLSEKIKTQSATATLLKTIAALTLGNIVLYLVGVPWLKLVTKLPWSGALVAGLLPFIPGIIIKIAAAVIIAQVLLPRFRQTAKTFQDDV